ncbi:MAG: BolA family transcriptional regulator [Rhodospirillaceae bacterium]|nr:BolA family transcriptional regulator [Rhodospirillaceae bacterium]
MGEYRDRMAAKLNAGLNPARLEFHDDSARHAGHAGASSDGRGETHFKVIIVSDAFTGQSRVARQRLVYGLVADELKERVHALELVLRAPDEG